MFTARLRSATRSPDQSSVPPGYGNVLPYAHHTTTLPPLYNSEPGSPTGLEVFSDRTGGNGDHAPRFAVATPPREVYYAPKRDGGGGQAPAVGGYPAGRSISPQRRPDPGSQFITAPLRRLPTPPAYVAPNINYPPYQPSVPAVPQQFTRPPSSQREESVHYATPLPANLRGAGPNISSFGGAAPYDVEAAQRSMLLRDSINNLEQKVQEMINRRAETEAQIDAEIAAQQAAEQGEEAEGATRDVKKAAYRATALRKNAETPTEIEMNSSHGSNSPEQSSLPPRRPMAKKKPASLAESQPEEITDDPNSPEAVGRRIHKNEVRAMKERIARIDNDLHRQLEGSHMGLKKESSLFRLHEEELSAKQRHVQKLAQLQMPTDPVDAANDLAEQIRLGKGGSSTTQSFASEPTSPFDGRRRRAQLRIEILQIQEDEHRSRLEVEAEAGTGWEELIDMETEALSIIENYEAEQDRARMAEIQAQLRLHQFLRERGEVHRANLITNIEVEALSARQHADEHHVNALSVQRQHESGHLYVQPTNQSPIPLPRPRTPPYEQQFVPPLPISTTPSNSGMKSNQQQSRPAIGQPVMTSSAILQNHQSSLQTTAEAWRKRRMYSSPFRTQEENEREGIVAHQVTDPSNVYLRSSDGLIVSPQRNGGPQKSAHQSMQQYSQASLQPVSQQRTLPPAPNPSREEFERSRQEDIAALRPTNSSTTATTIKSVRFVMTPEQEYAARITQQQIDHHLSQQKRRQYKKELMQRVLGQTPLTTTPNEISGAQSEVSFSQS